jgi:hypothetical protein
MSTADPKSTARSGYSVTDADADAGVLVDAVADTPAGAAVGSGGGLLPLLRPPPFWCGSRRGSCVCRSCAPPAFMETFQLSTRSTRRSPPCVY